MKSGQITADFQESGKVSVFNDKLKMYVSDGAIKRAVSCRTQLLTHGLSVALWRGKRCRWRNTSSSRNAGKENSGWPLGRGYGTPGHSFGDRCKLCESELWIRAKWLAKSSAFSASVVAVIEPEVRSGIVVALGEDIFAIDLTFDHQLWLPGFCSFNSSQSLLLCSRLAY